MLLARRVEHVERVGIELVRHERVMSARVASCHCRRKRGMIHKAKKKGRNMKSMLDTIVHHANAEDEATGDAFEIFHFSKVGNRSGQVRVPRQDLQKPEALYTLLVRKNAELPLCPKNLDQKLSQIIVSKPRRRFSIFRSSWLASRRMRVRYAQGGNWLFQNKSPASAAPLAWRSAPDRPTGSWHMGDLEGHGRKTVLAE